MNFTFFYLLIFGTLVSCQTVYGAIVPNPSISLISEYSNLTEDGFGETLYDITGVEKASNISVSSTMIKKIFLWTFSFDSGQQYELLDLENSTSITASHFLLNKPTFILVHGFLGNGLEPWIISTKDELLEQQTCNVVSVEWPSGHSYFVIDYYHVVRHVPIVGAEIAKLLDMLAQLRDQKNSAVHIIGHSLGAHIAGFVGKNVADPIARISGLDPAGFTYHSSDPSKRLDRGDATYVDVIHTNGCRSHYSWMDCFGIDTAIGHTDYWPNGGRHQPACQGNRQRRSRQPRGGEEETGLQTKVSWSVGCDHMMSHTYFLESLQYGWRSDMFHARPCDSYHHYKQGNCSCGEVPQYMGFHSKPSGVGDYFLNTSSTPPYALPDPACPGLCLKAFVQCLKLAVYVCLAVIIFVIVTSKLLGCLLPPPPMPRPDNHLRPELSLEDILAGPNSNLRSDYTGPHKCLCGRSDCTAPEYTTALVGQAAP